MSLEPSVEDSGVWNEESPEMKELSLVLEMEILHVTSSMPALELSKLSTADLCSGLCITPLGDWSRKEGTILYGTIEYPGGSFLTAATGLTSPDCRLSEGICT